MIQELTIKFPKISERKIYRLLLAIKMRYKKYGTIGISRLEGVRFGLSERQLQSFIYHLREIGAINKVGMVKSFKNAFKCNVYKLDEWFKEEVEKVKDFVKNTFEYIDPIMYVKSRFNTKTKYGQIKFTVNGIRYLINTRGNFKNVIYDTENNCIVNPLKLGN